MFLTKSLGWKKGLNKEKDQILDAKRNDVTELAECLLLTEQMR